MLPIIAVKFQDFTEENEEKVLSVDEKILIAVVFSPSKEQNYLKCNNEKSLSFHTGQL